LQGIHIGHALARLAQLLLRAEISPHGIVELQIAAARVIERLDRLPVGLTEVLEECIEVGICASADAVFRNPEMQHWRRRNGHFRHDARMRLEIFEMLEHRMMGEAKLPDDAQPLRLGLDAAELDSLLGFIQLDAVEHAQEIEMPPRAPEFAVGCELEPGLLLPGDDLINLAVFDGLELSCRDISFLAVGACFLQGLRTQQTADMIGAEWRLGSFHWFASLFSAMPGFTVPVHQCSILPGRRVPAAVTPRCASSSARSAASSALVPSCTTMPRSMMTARSVTASPFWAFCSTRMAETPSSRMIRRNAASSSSTRIGVSPSNGSSSSTMRGLRIRARPTASICCSPPES